MNFKRIKQEKINISKYINLDENYQFYGDAGLFINPSFLIKILEKELDMTFENIVKIVKNSQIIVDEFDIKQYLKQKLIEEQSDLNKKVEENERLKEQTNDREKTFDLAPINFSDKINLSKYSFKPYTLTYFKKYTEILKNKLLKLLNIVVKVSNKDNLEINNILEELNISLYDGIIREQDVLRVRWNRDFRRFYTGNIYYKDVARILEPIIYNFKLLREMINNANNLETYFDFSVSLDYIYFHGLNESAIYPSEDLQVKELLFEDIDGYIPLSEMQKEKLNEKELKTFKKNLSLVNEFLNK